MFYLYTLQNLRTLTAVLNLLTEEIPIITNINNKTHMVVIYSPYRFLQVKHSVEENSLFSALLEDV